MKKNTLRLTVVTLLVVLLSANFCFAGAGTSYNYSNETHKEFNQKVGYYVTETLTAEKIDLLFEDKATVREKELKEIIATVYDHAMQNENYFICSKLFHANEINKQRNIARSYVINVVENAMLSSIEDNKCITGYTAEEQNILNNIISTDKAVLDIYKEFVLR